PVAARRTLSVLPIPVLSSYPVSAASAQAVAASSKAAATRHAVSAFREGCCLSRSIPSPQLSGAIRTLCQNDRIEPHTSAAGVIAPVEALLNDSNSAGLLS